MTRTPAPALSPAEAARVAAFDAAPTPPEVVVERVAVAIFQAECDGCPCGGWESPKLDRGVYREMAAAAIAAMPPQEPFDLDAACQPVARQPQSTRTIRAALASPAPAPQGGGQR